MTRRVAILVFLLVAASVAYLLLPGPDVDPSTSSGDDVAESAHGNPESGVLIEGATAEVDDSEGMTRAELEDGPAAAATFQLLVIGVSQPLPQIKLPVRSCKLSEWRTAVSTNGEIPPRMLVDRAPSLTGDDGVIRLPAGMDEPLMVLVDSAAGRTWHQVGPAAADTIEQIYVPDAGAYAVQIVDQDGAPAIGIEAYSYLGEENHGYWGGVDGDVNRARAPDGIVYVSSLEQQRLMRAHAERRAAAKENRDPEPPDPLNASVSLLAIELPHVELPVPADDSVSRLELPPTGSLRIEVTGADSASGFIDVYGNADEEHFWGRSIRELPLKDGMLLVPYVGLGLELSVRLRLDGETGERDISVNGPQAPGEEVTARFNIDPELILVGTLVDSKDRPVTGSRVERALQASFRTDDPFSSPSITVYNGNWWPQEYQLELDEEGRFRVLLLHTEPGQIIEAVQIRFAHKVAGWTGQLSTDPTVHDLGEMKLDVAPALVSGTVVGPQGEPVADAVLSFEIRREGDPAIDPSAGEWMDYRGGGTRSADDGSFTIPRAYDVPDGRIRVSHDRYAQLRPLEVATGTTGIQVPMIAAGELVISVQSAEDFPDWSLQPQLIGRNGPVVISPGWDWGNGDVFSWEIPGLPPDTYTVGFRFGEYEELFAQVDGVVVTAGETTRDSRLTKVDLSSLFRFVEVTVRGADGVPLDEFQLQERFEDGSLHYRWGVGSDGGFWAPTGRKLQLEFEVEGQGRARASSDGGPVDVTLEPLPKVTIVVESGVKVETAEGRLVLALGSVQQENSAQLSVPWRPAEVDAGRSRTFEVPAAGKYSLHWFPVKDDWSRHYVTTLDITESQFGGRIVVSAPDEMQGS